MNLARAALDALPNIVYTVDLEGRITSVNRAWSRFAEGNGAPRLADEAVARGTRIWDVLTDGASRGQAERAMELLRTGRAPVVTWEFPCNSPTEERTFLMQVAALRDARAVTGYAFSTIDITPSHRSREALIEIGIALSRTIEAQRVFHDVSTLIRRAIPYDGFAIALRDERTGDLDVAHLAGFGDAGGSDAAARDLGARLRPRWRDALEGARVVRHHASDGIELTAPMIGAGGVVGAMTVVTESVEDGQRLEEAERVLSTIAAQTAVAIERTRLVRRVEEKRRLEAVGEVAAGIAHELRNPLFGISSAAQLLRFRSREDPVVERNVGRILREVERLNAMVTDLLEFGRPRPLTLAPGNPDDVWDDVLETHRGLLESHSLTLARTRGPASVIAIDAERLGQVFLNVLVNAVDAAPAGSDVALSSTLLPTGAWRCTLNNGGPPIAPDALPHVFEIFFSAKQGGTGIGLALCQRVIAEHHGTIAIDSSAAHGTTLTITLPPLAVGTIV
ncbi:MAG: ATP-binding protein [Gemmatimonadaceae bacterium]